jgi:hypothetical protein
VRLPSTARTSRPSRTAAAVANRTMHGVMHLGWVPDETGGYRGHA